MPSVGAVVPAYNAAPYIEETLLSLCKQSLPLSEIIVVDDASTDNTVDIVLSLAKQYKLIKLERLPVNSGPSAARNHGLALADTEWILFMDADDIAEPHLIEKEFQRLHELEDEFPGQWVLCYTAYTFIDSLGNEITPAFRYKQVYPDEALGYQFIRCNMGPSGVLVKHQDLLDVGGFDVTLRYFEDHDLWLKLAFRGGFVYVDEPLIKRRRHSNNATARLSNAFGAEKKVLSKYPLEIIKVAIYRRRLPWWINASDFVSVLYILEYWENGLAIIKNVVENNPAFAKGFFLLGLYYLHAKLLEKAINCFYKTIELDPYNGAALNNLGTLLALYGKVDNALCLLTKAIELFPNYLDAGNNLKNLKLGRLSFENARFTWRELRPALVSYQEE